MNVYDQAYALAKALRDSQQYVELRRRKEKIEANPSKKQMLLDFLEKQLAAETARLSGDKLAEERIKQVETLYQVISADEDIRAYLSAQFSMTQVWADLQKILGEVLEEVVLSPLAK